MTIFTFLIITNFKTDRYLNNFQEQLFGILRLRKYQTSKISFPRENEAIKHDLVEFKVSMFERLLLQWQQIYHFAFLFNF